MKFNSLLTISNDDVQLFAKWCHDVNPLHVDLQTARQTFFGKPIVHGILTIIESLLNVSVKDDVILYSLEAEFRRPVFPEERYVLQGDGGRGKLKLTLSDEQGVCLSLLAKYGGPKENITTKATWLDTISSAARESETQYRQEAADLDAVDFRKPISISGYYTTDAVPEHYLQNKMLTPTIVRILGLSSYLVGMELPGLRSLFTRIRLTFLHAENNTETIAYHVATNRFNEPFRALQTALEVADDQRVLIASGELRSYVRFCPLKTDFDRLAYAAGGFRDRLEGKVALVCGGSRGLGAELVATLALAGCHVIASHRTQSQARDDFSTTLDEKGLNVTFMTGDAGDAAWCEQVLKKITDSYGRLDILVLNACSSPSPIGITSSAATGFTQYVSNNLRLVQQPLTSFLPLLEKSAGSLTAISSSFVEEMPKGFAHYVALKQAVEAMIHSVAKEFTNVSYLIPRPPRLRTSWNDTPSGVMRAIPVDQVAASVVDAIVKDGQRGAVKLVSEFPALETETEDSGTQPPDLNIVVSASFTIDPILSGLKFWLKELSHNAGVEIAPYGQVLQELINPTSALSSNQNGMGVVFLRLGDWLRELADEKINSSQYVQEYLNKTAKEFLRAMRTHRSHAAVETILVFCPSAAFSSDHLNTLFAGIEAELLEALKALPGLTTIVARDFHRHYDVSEEDIHDSLREQIGHIPFQRPYFHVLATIVIRQIQRRLVPLRKVVVVDCDNTLWDGVVGEVGADGLVFNDTQVELHGVLTRLSQSGVIICLCSKNEDFDVWSAFDNRHDFGLSRESIVAAMINWNPKSENIRQLAARLNLGMDSFIFIDDNPVECAEVQAACPQVLVLQWPRDVERARQLLRHTWELDPKQGTKEDAKRTQMYREEFKRQELLDDNLSFADFIKGLELEVDLRPLNEEDLPRASQLTMRTNQFNFTTIRRKESELKPLMEDEAFECGTIRVHDRFGDYGLVGLFIAKIHEDALELDTFLLSCRILGRGVEHHLMAELGRKAIAHGIGTVRMHVDPTPRNTPARNFLASITPDEFGRSEDSGRFVSELPAERLAALVFQPENKTSDTARDEKKQDVKSGDKSEDDAQRMRSRESQIERAAYDLFSIDKLSEAIDGLNSRSLPSGQAVSSQATPEEVRAFIYDVFSSELGLSVDQIKETDKLAPLGCDSLKIVEITVALIERFPWLPITLLFEHRSVSDIADHITNLAGTGKGKKGPWMLERGVKPQQKRLIETHRDIAVVGLDVRCAGASSPDELWALLRHGETAVRPISAQCDYFLYPFKGNRPHWAGMMDGIEGFDAEFFGIAPREAELIDPQIRLFLEVAWSALEDAGLVNGLQDIDVGVYAGKMYDDYVYMANRMLTADQSPYRSWESFSMANRLSHFLNLRGPSLTVNTACSSSGTALHLACQAIQEGECNLAIVGGSNLILDPERFSQLGRLGILSPTGRCLPFGDLADGTVLGEGVGVVILKALDDALQNGDRIHGVIKGSALSAGTGTVGFTVPNPNAQALAIRKSLAAAGVDPRTISYVETHGTGTQLGDPIEVRGLMMAFADKQLWDDAINGAQHCRIGSIKPNTGHLESGACIMGLIKILLQFRYASLVPTITSENPNPQIPFNLGPFKIQTRLEPWESPVMSVNGDSIPMPRRAGLSSFGVGGANAHFILEEPPNTIGRETEALADESDQASVQILTLTARHTDTLKAQMDRIKEYLQNRPDLSIRDVCYTTNCARAHFNHRLALIVSGREQLLEATEAYGAGEIPRGCFTGTVSRSAPEPKISFLFTGQGVQYAGMGCALYDTYPVFKDALERCAKILEGLVEEPLLDVLFPQKDEPRVELLHQTGITQPALFALEYAVSELWKSWGIQPDFVMGHSAGEIIALTVAGVLTLEEGLKLIAARGRLMQALPAGGKMAAIRADESRIMAELSEMSGPVSIAAINGPQHTVISGAGNAIDDLVTRFKSENIEATLLKVSHAFHSALIEPMLPQYKAVYGILNSKTPSVPVISCVNGKIFDPSSDISGYWKDQVRRPVRFLDAMAELDRQGTNVYLEVGPHPVLLGMGSLCLPYEDRIWLPSLRRGSEGKATILKSLAKLYVRGCGVDWESFNRSSKAKKVGLPTYPFRHRRYWIDRSQSKEMAERDISPVVSYSDCMYDIVWQPESIDTPKEETALQSGKWLIFADQDGVGKTLAQILAEKGALSVLVYPGQVYGKNSDGGFRLNPAENQDFERLLKEVTEDKQKIRGAIFLWSLDLPGTDELTAGNLVYSRQVVLNSAVHLCRAIINGFTTTDARIWLVTRDAVDTGMESIASQIALSQAPLWGFGRVLALEHPEIWGGLTDLTTVGMSVTDNAKSLYRELLSKDQEDQVAIRPNGRLVARLLKRQAEPVESFTVNPKGLYLITGGSGALGRKLANWLVAKGAKHLMITGRSDQTTSKIADMLEKLKKQGVEIDYLKIDVGSPKDMEALEALIRSAPHPLKGVAHLAGVDSRISIPALTERDLQSVMAPKIEGGWMLHKLTAKENLDFFIMFSSMAAVLGSDGRAHYAAANAFLDALAHHRRRCGLPSTAVNWGPWRDGGMASEEDLSFYDRMGNRGLDPEGALKALEQLIAGNNVQTMIADIGWPQFRSIYTAKRHRPLIYELETVTEAQSGVAEALIPEWYKQLQEQSIEERPLLLKNLIQNSVAQMLGFENPDDISNDLDFSEMGMDSLRAVELTIHIQKMLGIEESITLYDHPNISVLAEWLIERLAMDHAEKRLDTIPEGRKIVNYSKGIEADVLDFYRTAWPNRAKDTIESRWRWMFIDSAERLAVPPRMWIYREASSVVGFTGAIPVKLKIGNDEIDTAWCVDTMVLESCRRVGLGPDIMVQAKKDLPFSLSLGQTKEMRLILAKLGWKQFAELQTYVYPIRPQRMLQGKLNPVLAGPVGTGIQLRQYTKRLQSTGKIRQFDINEIKHFESRHDRLWQEIKESYTCVVVRDSSYLNWKYVDQPGQDFIRLEMLDNGKVVAVAVLMLREPGANSPYLYRRAFIVELIASPLDSITVKSVLELIRQRCLQLDLDSIVFELINEKIEKELASFGFIKRDPTRFLWICTDNNDEKRNEIVTNGRNWLVTKGDSDVDRPE